MLEFCSQSKILHNNKKFWYKYFQLLSAQSRQRYSSNSYTPPNEPQQKQKKLERQNQNKILHQTAKEISGLQLRTTHPTLAHKHTYQETCMSLEVGHWIWYTYYKYHHKSNINVHLTATIFYIWRKVTNKSLKWRCPQSLTVHQLFTNSTKDLFRQEVRYNIPSEFNTFLAIKITQPTVKSGTGVNICLDHFQLNVKKNQEVTELKDHLLCYSKYIFIALW